MIRLPAILLLLLFACSAWAAPPLDGSASGFVNHGSNFTITITTTQADDVLLLYTRTECCEGGPGPAFTVSGVASGTLTMAKRTACHTDVPDGAGASDYGEGCYWWVHAPLALTNEVFTVTLSGSTPTAAGFMAAFSGAATPASPFDANSGLPSLGAHDANPAAQVRGGSITTNSNLVTLLAVGGDDNAAVVSNLQIIDNNSNVWIKVGSINGNGAPEANFASASIGYLAAQPCTIGVNAAWGPPFLAYQSAAWGDALVMAGAMNCSGPGPSPFLARPFAHGWPW